MGKLNMHELAFGITSNNGAFGPARNPYDPARIPGGSSGGSGAAVAARMAPVAMGTDTGGSVRVPAALCGVAGFRPTTGRYSQAGIVPISSTRDTAGPLARSVEDLALFDGVIARGARRFAGHAPQGGPDRCPARAFYENLHPETSHVAEAALTALGEAGAVLVEADMPDVPKLDGAAGFPVALFETVVELNRYLSESGLPLDLASLAAAVASPDVAGLLQGVLTPEGAIPEPVYREALTQTRPALQAAYAGYFATNDVVAAIFPTTPLPASLIGEGRNGRAERRTGADLPHLHPQYRSVQPCRHSRRHPAGRALLRRSADRHGARRSGRERPRLAGLERGRGSGAARHPGPAFRGTPELTIRRQS